MIERVLEASKIDHFYGGGMLHCTVKGSGVKFPSGMPDYCPFCGQELDGGDE